jgi:biopolymer transport protein TolR
MAFSSGGSGSRAPLSEINVTPLVDVMLVLLIIFMVAAPMMTAGVEVDLPEADAPRMGIDEDKVLLSIDADSRVFVGEEEVPIERLEDRLAHDERLQRDREIFVQADASVRYGFVVSVLALIRRAGVEQMNLVTDPMGAGSVEVPGAAASTAHPASPSASPGAAVPPGTAAPATP